MSILWESFKAPMEKVENCYLYYHYTVIWEWSHRNDLIHSLLPSPLSLPIFRLSPFFSWAICQTPNRSKGLTLPPLQAMIFKTKEEKHVSCLSKKTILAPYVLFFIYFFNIVSPIIPSSPLPNHVQLVPQHLWPSHPKEDTMLCCVCCLYNSQSFFLHTLHVPTYFFFV